MHSQASERDHSETRASGFPETPGDRIRLIAFEVAVYAIMLLCVIAAAQGPGIPLG